MARAKLISKAKLPTKYGNFYIYGFEKNGREHVALTKGETRNGPVNVRVHSKCLTGDAFRSFKCDCGEQLEKSLRYIGKNGGVLIYLDQEGRGIGLVNKIRAYALQDHGFDTIESNEMLGFEGDERDYSVVVEILATLGISDTKLLTNNPSKMEFLKKSGIGVRRIPLITKPNKHNALYLKTKRSKAGHLL